MIFKTNKNLSIDQNIKRLYNNFLNEKLAYAFYYLDTQSLEPLLDETMVTLRYPETNSWFNTKQETLDDLKKIFAMLRNDPETYHVHMVNFSPRKENSYKLYLEYKGEWYMVNAIAQNGFICYISIIKSKAELDNILTDSEIFEEKAEVKELPKVGDEFMHKTNGVVDYFCKVTEVNKEYVRIDGCKLCENYFFNKIGSIIPSSCFYQMDLTPTEKKVFDKYMDLFEEMMERVTLIVMNSKETRNLSFEDGETFLDANANIIYQLHDINKRSRKKQEPAKAYSFTLGVHSTEMEHCYILREELESMEPLRRDTLIKVSKMYQITYSKIESFFI